MFLKNILFAHAHTQVVQYLADVVSQFPSENECERFIASANSENQELKARLQKCKVSIEQAKDKQAEEADKQAENLLNEIDGERVCVISYVKLEA